MTIFRCTYCILCVCAFCLCVCVCMRAWERACMPCVCGGQKRALNMPEPELLMIISCHTDARNPTQVLHENSQSSSVLSHLSNRT